MNSVDFFKEMRATVLTESVSRLAAGGMFFNQEDVQVTEDIEDEYVPQNRDIIFIETRHAQELSWLMHKFKDSIPDVVSYYGKKTFYEELAEDAKMCILKTDDLSALLLAVLNKAELLSIQAMEYKAQDLKDEVLACVAGLSDLAEKIGV